MRAKVNPTIQPMKPTPAPSGPRSASGVLLNVPRRTTSRNPGPTSPGQSPFPVRPATSISSAKGGGVAKRDHVDDVSDPDSPLYDPDDPAYDPSRDPSGGE
jgi:hypothetical protein